MTWWRTPGKVQDEERKGIQAGTAGHGSLTQLAPLLAMGAHPKPDSWSVVPLSLALAKDRRSESRRLAVCSIRPHRVPIFQSCVVR
jgi:hypothetical protein